MNQFICKSGWTSVFKLVLSVWWAELWSLGGSISKFDSLLEPHSRYQSWCCHLLLICADYVSKLSRTTCDSSNAVPSVSFSCTLELITVFFFFEAVSCSLKNNNVASLIWFLLFSSFCVFMFAVFLIGAEACHYWNVSFLAEILCDHLQLNTQLF